MNPRHNYWVSRQKLDTALENKMFQKLELNIKSVIK